MLVGVQAGPDGEHDTASSVTGGVAARAWSWWGSSAVLGVVLAEGEGDGGAWEQGSSSGGC